MELLGSFTRTYTRLLAIFIAIFALADFTNAQSNWIASRAPTTGDLVAVYFTSDKTGWIAGDNGYLASTSDGGGTWNKYPLNTTEDINEIYFRNDNNGYIVAGRQMFITKDAGRTWQQTQLLAPGEIRKGTPEFLSIRFPGKKLGFAIGSVWQHIGKDDIITESLVMRTDDGGDTWTRVQVPAKVELYHLDFTDNSHGWIVGDKGLIMTTSDGGLTWQTQRSGIQQALFNVDFRDNDNGYAVGSKGTILRTEDGGATWTRVASPYPESLMRVDFSDDKNGWIVGHGGAILRSGDRGVTWLRQASNTSEKIYGLFMSKKYGWAVGEKGLILKWTR